MGINQQSLWRTCFRRLRIPVDEDVVEPELQDEGLELLLNLEQCVLPFLLGKDVEGMYRPAIHDEVLGQNGVVESSRYRGRKSGVAAGWHVWRGRSRTNCREGPINHFTRCRTRLSRMETRDPCRWRKVISACATTSGRGAGTWMSRDTCQLRHTATCQPVSPSCRGLSFCLGLAVLLS